MISPTICFCVSPNDCNSLIWELLGSSALLFLTIQLSHFSIFLSELTTGAPWCRTLFNSRISYFIDLNPQERILRISCKCDLPIFECWHCLTQLTTEVADLYLMHLALFTLDFSCLKKLHCCSQKILCHHYLSISFFLFSLIYLDIHSHSPRNVSWLSWRREPHQ